MASSHPHPTRQRDEAAIVAEMMNREDTGNDALGLRDVLPSEIPNPNPTKSFISKPTDVAISTDRIAVETGHATIPTTEVSTTSSSPSASPTQDSSSSNESSGGTSAGVKAGIAFGVLGGVLLLSALIYFLITRRKNKANSKNPEQGEEKYSRPVPPQKDTMQKDVVQKAPRLSLRPVTQFFDGGNSNKRASRGDVALAPTSNGSNKPLPNGGNSPLPNPFDRPNTGHSSISTNPFGYAAERPVSPLTDSASAISANPFGNEAERPVSPITEDQKSVYSRAHSPDRAISSTRNTTVGYTHGTRVTSTHVDIESIDFTLPPPSRGAPSPTGTEFSMSSIAPGTNAPPTNGAAAIAAAGGPQNTSVHRVQLDFKPSLEDEMELRAGELVRLLHEYDDGWALCIKLDRSRQGVAPRTCLSTRPVKPRNPQGGSRGGPPVNPQVPQSSNFPFASRDRDQSPRRPKTPNGPGRVPGPGARSESPNVWPSASSVQNQSPGHRYLGGPDGRNRTAQPSRMNPANRPVSPEARGSLPGTAL